MGQKAEVADTTRIPLSRERLIAAAVKLADSEGIEALSMRRLAAELGATPMALYNHVSGKDELLNGISGQLLQEIDLSGIDPNDWAASLKTGYTDFRRVLLAHPNLLPVLQRKSEVSPEAMKPIELAMTLLRRAGFTPEEALHAHWTLSGFTMGHVLWQITTPLLDEFDQGLRAGALQHHKMLPADQFPCLHEVLPSLEECDMEAAWEFGIDSIIEGFKAKLALRSAAAAGTAEN
jgi:TetR/AcrR family transcriptional regulator, tetracycline repressor protein